MPILHATTYGTGPDLVILHGFLGMSDNWKTLAKSYVEAGFRVHLIDQRNHGKSFHSTDFSYAHMAADLEGYMEANSIKKAHLLGHSMGGKTAMYFACKYPEKTEKLIVADIGPKSYPPHHSEILEALTAMQKQVFSSRSSAEDFLAQRISEAGVRQFLLKNLYWVVPGQLGFRANIPVLAEGMEAVGAALPLEMTFKKPSLFLAGGNSHYILEEDHLSIKQAFPAAQIETVKNAGHWLHAENPKEFYQKSIAFLKA